MAEREPIRPDDVKVAASWAIGVLSPLCDRDWTVNAGGLDWSCLFTADHIAGCLFCYAGQIVARPTDTWVPFEAHIDEGTEPAGYLQFIETGAAILTDVVRSAPSTARAYHSYGIADPEGFAGMGILEILLHTHDITTGLGAAGGVPPEDLCRRVLARMFPTVPDHDDTWRNLLWATGRADLPGRERRTDWKWRAAPLGEG